MYFWKANSFELCPIEHKVAQCSFFHLHLVLIYINGPWPLLADHFVRVTKTGSVLQSLIDVHVYNYNNLWRLQESVPL